MDASAPAGPTPPPPPLLTVEDVARILGKPRSWVYSAARAGTLPSVRVGQARRFEVEELTRWIAEQRTSRRSDAAG